MSEKEENERSSVKERYMCQLKNCTASGKVSERGIGKKKELPGDLLQLAIEIEEIKDFNSYKLPETVVTELAIRLKLPRIFKIVSHR